MGYLANPKHYGRQDFQAYIDSLSWDKGWVPQFPTLHNTGVPSLALWQSYGLTVQERWGMSLDNYYRGLGWHSAPHLVTCPDYIWVLCDPEADGVSVSCWNHLTFGIEMIGDYEVDGDDPTTGDGAKVIDNAVFAIAVLAVKLKWTIGTIIKGVGGLHFHRECARDAHLCPGTRIDKGVILSRILKLMSAMNGTSPLAQPPVAPPMLAGGPPSDPDGMIRWTQLALNRLGAAEQRIVVDGKQGPLTDAAVESFQLSHSLEVDGQIGPHTIGALKKSLGIA